MSAPLPSAKDSVEKLWIWACRHAGCDFKGGVDEVDKHERECMHMQYMCSKCNQLTSPYKEVSEPHKCPAVLPKDTKWDGYCKQCSAFVGADDAAVDAHYKVCPIIQRQPCPYAFCGCTFWGNEPQMREHAVGLDSFYVHAKNWRDRYEEMQAQIKTLMHSALASVASAPGGGYVAAATDGKISRPHVRHKDDFALKSMIVVQQDNGIWELGIIRTRILKETKLVAVEVHWANFPKVLRPDTDMVVHIDGKRVIKHVMPQHMHTFSTTLQPGSGADVCVSNPICGYNNWRTGVVLEINDTHAYIQYASDTPDHTEWISKTSPRLLPAGFITRLPQMEEKDDRVKFDIPSERKHTGHTETNISPLALPPPRALSDRYVLANVSALPPAAASLPHPSEDGMPPLETLPHTDADEGSAAAAVSVHPTSPADVS